MFDACGFILGAETTPKRAHVVDQGAAARCDGRHRKYAAEFDTVSVAEVEVVGVQVLDATTGFG